MRIIILLLVIFSMIQIAVASKIEVEDQYDMKLAVDYALSNHIDSLVLVTSGGVYTTVDSLMITEPLAIVAAPGLAEKPIITNSSSDSSELEIFRVYDDFYIEGVVLDGGHARSHGMKYGIRVYGINTTPSSRVGLNVICRDVDFRDFFRNKLPTEDGHAIYFLIDVDAGSVIVENCTIMNTGYEAIRMTETEKYSIDRCLDTLIVRNCTFVNIDNECVRFYGDMDTSNTDAYVRMEHLTIDASAARAFYIKNSNNTILRDVIFTNSRLDGRGDRSDYIAEVQLPGSHISHIDTFNVVFDSLSVRPETIRGTKGADVDTTTVYGFDPLYADRLNFDFSLLPNSPAYGKSYSGNALGDLNWADPTVSIDQGEDLLKPAGFSLDQNYPNPFNPSTTIRFTLSKLARVKLKIFDITGSHIATLVNAPRGVGEHSVTWAPSSAASGIYFYNLEVDGKISDTRKMILIK